MPSVCEVLQRLCWLCVDRLRYNDLYAECSVWLTKKFKFSYSVEWILFTIASKVDGSTHLTGSVFLTSQCDALVDLTRNQWCKQRHKQPTKVHLHSECFYFWFCKKKSSYQTFERVHLTGIVQSICTNNQLIVASFLSRAFIFSFFKSIEIDTTCLRACEVNWKKEWNSHRVRCEWMWKLGGGHCYECNMLTFQFNQTLGWQQNTNKKWSVAKKICAL